MLKRTPSPPSFLQTIWWWILVATTSRGLAQAPQGGLTTTNTLTGSAPDTLSRKGKKWFLEYWRLWWVPNQQRTLHKLPTELLCRSFVTSKQPTGLVKSVPHVQKHVLGNVCVCVFRLSFHLARHCWWLGQVVCKLEISLGLLTEPILSKKKTFEDFWAERTFADRGDMNLWVTSSQSCMFQ